MIDPNEKIRFFVWLYLLANDFEWKPRQMSASLNRVLEVFLNTLVGEPDVLKRLNYLS